MPLRPRTYRLGASIADLDCSQNTRLSFEFCLERFGAIDAPSEILLPTQIADTKPPESLSSITAALAYQH
jgi:hypothetical protein